MAAGEVLFVNKTASSGTLSRSKGLERAKIFSHLQRSSFNRAPSSAKDLQKPTVAPKKKESTKRDVDSSGDVSENLPRRAGRDATSTIKTQEVTKPAKIVNSVAGNAHLTFDMLIASRPDPFDTTAAPCSFYMDCLLKFFASDLLPRIYPNKTMAEISRRSTISMSFQDPMLMFTLLSTTAAGIYSASQLKTHAVAAMTFKVRAIEALNAELSQPKSAKFGLSTVNTVALLLWLECLQGNAADLRAHAAGLNHLVHQLEDLREIPLPVLATVLSCSYFCSAYLQIRPAIEPIILSANSLSPTAQSLLSSSRNPFYTGLASSLFTPSNLTLLGPYLASIAIEQHSNILLREELSRPGPATTYSDVEFAYTKEIWIDYSLASLPFDHDLTPAQDAVRIALFVFLQPIILVTQPSAAFCRVMAKQLKDALEESDWGERRGVLLWVLFIGCYLSVGEELGPWFVGEMVELMKFLGDGEEGGG